MQTATKVNDLFLVYIDDAIIENYQQVLIDLYQPFVGTRAIALYLTLKNCNFGQDPTSYHRLIAQCSCDFSDLRAEFAKLEAANLITTYAGSVDEFSLLVYQVNSPLTPYHFLKDLMLIKVLTSFAGEEVLAEIKAREQKRTAHVDAISGLTNISHLLKDVYQQNLSAPIVDQALIEQQKPALHTNNETKFNFDTFLIHLPTSVRVAYDFEVEMRQLILKLANMYDLDSQQMAIIFNIALQKNKGIISDKLLRKEAYNFVIEDLRRENLRHEIRTSEKAKAAAAGLPKPIQNPAVQRALSQMKQLSSLEYVKLLTGSITPQDYKNIERLSLEYHLPEEVINVLINYVYRSKKTLSLPLMEAIAQGWHKQKIETAEAAYFALRDNQQKSKQRKTTSTAQNMPVRARRTENKSNFDDQKLGVDDLALVEKLFEELGD
jgi:replication initiation and membrane attachment protein